MKKFLIAAAVLGLIALALKQREKQKAEWHGLTEAEARQKLDQKLPSRMPAERREAVTDKIVDRMRDRGVIESDGDDLVDLTESAPAEAEAATPG